MLIAPGMSEKIASTIRYVNFAGLILGAGMIFFCVSDGSGGSGGSVFVGAVELVLLQPRPSLNKPSGKLWVHTMDGFLFEFSGTPVSG